MKKICLTGAVLMMALMIAAPSFAVEHKVSGTFTLNGVLNQNPALSGDSDQKETVSYREMQLRIHTESQVTDKITLYTRFDILDKVLSSQFSNTVDAEDDDNIQFDHAWMQIISPIGVFRVGRKEGVKWGTDFLDDGDDYGTDRAEWIIPFDVGTGGDKFVFAAIAEKALETKESNRDNDKFYITGTYVGNEYKTGLLVGLYKYNSYKQEQGNNELNDAYAAHVHAMTNGTAYDQSLTGAALQTALIGDEDTDGYKPRAPGEVVYISPYFSGKIGPIEIQAEYDYVSGEVETKDVNPIFSDAIINPPGYPAGAGQAFYDAAVGNKKDVKMSGYWLEAAYPAGAARFELGIANMSGDDDQDLNDLNSIGLLAQGEDWAKMFILTGDDHGMDEYLGGDGNALQYSPASDMAFAGLNLLYIGADYDINESINIGGIVGLATADEEMSGWEDDYGTEIDLTLTWKFMGNLQYNGTAAYLIAGDFWQKGNAAADVGDCLALYHELVLSF